MSRRSFIENGDTSNVEVIISSDRVSTQTQEPTVPSNVTNTEVELSSLKQELYTYTLQNMWDEAKSIYDKFPDMVRIPLTSSGDTALHVAVTANNTDFVKKFVNFEHVTPKDLEIPNAEGNTAFCIATVQGSAKFLQIMTTKNENLPLIPRHDEMLPVHFATLSCYHKIVQDLSSEGLLQKMDFKDIERLFFMAIKSNMYEVATKLVEKYPRSLSIARDDEENLTALHMLARKPSEKSYMQVNNQNGKAFWYMNGKAFGYKNKMHEHCSYKKGGSPWELLKNIWAQVRELEYKKRLTLITEPSIVLFDAVKSTNVEVVKWLLYMNRELLTIKDPKSGQNLLHLVVSHGQRDLLCFILKMRTVKLILRAVDNDRNNVLHFAACQLSEASSSLRTRSKLRGDWRWLMRVEKRVPLELRTMRNKEGKTARDIFYGSLINLSKEAKDAAEKIASSGMVVGALIATITFAAALTIPGGQDNITNPIFGVFILANAIGLCSSSLSISYFLSVFAAPRFSRWLFNIFYLYAFLIDMGQLMLSISNAVMLIDFILASFLILNHTHFKWVSYGVAFCGLLALSRTVRP